MVLCHARTILAGSSFSSGRDYSFEGEIDPAPEDLADDSGKNKEGDIPEIEMR